MPSAEQLRAPRFNHHALHSWRIDSDLSPEQVAVQARVSYPYLHRLENGTADNPSFAVMARLAAVYGRDPGELFSGLDPDAAGAR